MQFKDAAYEFLKEAGRPLHYNEITDLALKKNILETAGQTPHATMGALLYTDTLKENSRFRRGDEKGTFALAVAAPKGIKQQIEAIRANMREYFSMLCYSEQKRDAFLSIADSFTYRSEVNKMLWTDATQFDLGPELAKFQLPTLVINGRYDMNVAPIVAFKIQEAIAGSHIAIFEQSGHLPFFEEPELFMNTVDTFLRG